MTIFADFSGIVDFNKGDTALVFVTFITIKDRKHILLTAIKYMSH